MRRRLVEFTLMIAFMFVVPSAWADMLPQPADDEPSDVATVWFDTLYDVVKSEATAFPEASRIYGISAVALYEAVVPGTLDNRSLVGQLDGLTSVPQPTEHRKYHWPTVANAALARTIRGIFPSLKPENLEAINALEQRFAAQFQAEVEEQAYQRSVAQGQRSPTRFSRGPPPMGFRASTTVRMSPRQCPAPGSRRRPISPRTRSSPAGGSSGRWS